MTRLFPVALLVFAGCEPAEPVTVTVAATTFEEGIEGATVDAYTEFADFVSGTNAAASAELNADGMATLALDKGEGYWIDVQVSDTVNNYGDEVILESAEEGAVLETFLDRNWAGVIAGTDNRSWVVTGAVADESRAGTPSNEQLNCWLGAVFTFERNLLQGGMTVEPDGACALFDLSVYNEWTLNASVEPMLRSTNDDAFRLQLFDLRLSDNEISAAIQMDLTGDGLGNFESNMVFTLTRQ